MNRNLAVGAFILIGLALFTIGLFMIGNRHEAFAEHFTVYTDLAHLSGISKGSRVQVAGMGAGQVEEIRIPSSPAFKFRLKLRLEEKLHGLMRTDSVVTIGTEGVVGDTFVMIEPGSAAAPAVPVEGVLRSKEPTELADLLDQAKGTIEDVDATVKNANGLLTSVGGNLNATLTTAHGTVSDVDTIVNGIKRGDGAVGMLLRDPNVAQSVKQTITDIQGTTKNLQDASSNANAIVADVQARKFPQKIDDTLGSVRDATSRLDGASENVQKLVSTLNAPDGSGASGGENLREAMSNIDVASGNFSEDTEALKRNFLVRGFFRRRGYYSLLRMNPEAYRKDPTFTNSKDDRVWLSEDKLFIRNANGQEELTSEGRTQIDQTTAPYSDVLQGTAIMIEGYSGTSDPSEKMVLSRERAVLVRDYLLRHYHLEASAAGAIGLSDKAPRGAEHSTWNGICIVLVHPGR